MVVVLHRKDSQKVRVAVVVFRMKGSQKVVLAVVVLCMKGSQKEGMVVAGFHMKGSQKEMVLEVKAEDGMDHSHKQLVKACHSQEPPLNQQNHG